MVSLGFIVYKTLFRTNVPWEGFKNYLGNEKKALKNQIHFEVLSLYLLTFSILL